MNRKPGPTWNDAPMERTRLLNEWDESSRKWICRMVLPFVPGSKKNKMIVTKSGEPCPVCGRRPKGGIGLSKRAKKQEKIIYAVAKAHGGWVQKKVPLEAVAGVEEMVAEMIGWRGDKTHYLVQLLLRRVFGTDPETVPPPIPRDHHVQVDVTVVVGEKAWQDGVIVDVFDLGPWPGGGLAFHRSTRQQDVANVPALILDALQGAIYGNDRQVSHLNVRTLRTKDLDTALEYMAPDSEGPQPLSVSPRDKD